MEPLYYHYIVDGDDFSVAGEKSSKVKKILKQLGFNPVVIRCVAIAMYEAEINMVIHANGGYIDVYINPDEVKVIFCDMGPGIPDINKAMSEGYSTATNQVRELGFGAGMGLPNIKKYTDKLDIDTTVGKGTTLTFSVYCNKEE